MKKNVGLMIAALNSGGAERVVSHLSHILSKEYNVHVILFEDTWIEYECDGTMHNLNVPSKKGSVFTKIRLLRKRVNSLKNVIKSEKLDCVISFLDSPNFVNLFARVKGCKRIISIRNYSSIENRHSRLGQLVNKMIKRLYKKADCVVAVSKLIEQDFISHYDIPVEKICTIYNPYSFDDIILKSMEPISAKEQDFYREHFVFLNVGRIVYQKGVWHLIKAFAELKKSHPNVGLVIVGEDLSNGKLKSLIEALGLEDDVLLTGRTKNPYKYMKNSQCYVLSSLFEGFPNAMVEAMACGCPIVATDCKSGPREILCNNPRLDETVKKIEIADYGILVPNLDTEEKWDTDITDCEKQLSDAMRLLVEDVDLKTKLSNASKNRSLLYNYETCFLNYSKLI